MRKSVLKRVLYFLTAMTLWVGTAVPAAAADVSVTVSGNPVQWTDATPFIDSNSRTLVPLRAVGEALGLNVDWNDSAREAVFSNGEKTIYFPIDKNTARTGDGGTVAMDTSAIIRNDRTYAPVRYLAEYFGYTVDWDGASSTVVIGRGSGAEPYTGFVLPENLTFKDLSTTEFIFCSGAGGWETSMTINEDGTFSGSFHDSDMGDTGEGYPNGIVYFCEFSGQFEAPVKVNDYTYSMKIKSLKTTDPTEAPTIEDGVKFIPSGPYGIENTDELLVYLPGTSVELLPEEFVSWVSAPLVVDFYEMGSIDFYGLYNPVEKDGFFSAVG